MLDSVWVWWVAQRKKFLMIGDADLGLLFGIDGFENRTNLSGVVLDRVLLAIRHVFLPALNTLLVDFVDEL